MRSLGIEGWVLQFDNYSKSSEHQSEGLFEKEIYKTIDWHPYSSDLSPT